MEYVSPDFDITVKKIGDAIVEQLEGFATTLGGVPIEVKQTYFQKENLSAAGVTIYVYPLTQRTRRKTRGAKQKSVGFDVVVDESVPKKEPARIDLLIDFCDALDNHFEAVGGLLDHVSPFYDDTDDRFLWLPDWLVLKNRFVSILNLQYVWNSQLGVG